MSNTTLTPFEQFLGEHDQEAWFATLAELAPYVHEVDRNATAIWFYFFPLDLLRAFQSTEDPKRLALELEMQGNYFLKDQIDSSHKFLYGHRFWPEVKREVVRVAEATSAPVNLILASQIREIASSVAAGRKTEQSLVVGIAAVAVMTLHQVGLDEFKKTPGTVLIEASYQKKSPTQVLKERAVNDSQGIFGFLRTTDKRWTVVWDENQPDRRFNVVQLQEVASGAATDKRPWHEIDPRCTINEGPIPVQCRSASCGTCWVGVLGGAEKLTEVATREKRKMPEFGYIVTDNPRPLIRLSCQAQATGALSIVIPPWNGYFGKYLKDKKTATTTPGESQSTD